MPKMQTPQFDDFGKGLNLFTRDTMLKENESPVAYNVWAVGKNSVKKRPGIIKLCTIPGASQIDGLGTYYNGATRELIAMAGGKLYKVQTGTAVELTGSNTFTSGNRTDFCQAGGKLFIANGIENIRNYNGSTVAEQAGTIIAKYMIFYKGSLWAGGNTGAGNGTRLYRSGTDVNIGNFTYQTSKTGTTTGTTANKLVDSAGSFTTSNVTVGCTVLNSADGTTATITAIDSTTQLALDKDIFVTGKSYVIANNSLATSTYISQSDGQDLKGLFKHQDFLYPVKERSLWRTSVGSDAYQLITNELVDPSRGCDSHFSIDTVDNDNFMFNELGVFATGYEPNILDQIRTNIVSLRIDTKLKQIQKSRLDDVVGIYYDNHYYLSYTSGGGTYNDTIMVYDRQRLGWYEFQLSDVSGNRTGANCFTEYKNTSGETKLYFGSATDGSIYYFEEAVKQDAGWTIITDFKTGKWSFKDFSQMKFFYQALIYFGKTPGKPTVNVYIDGSLAKTAYPSIGTSGTSGMGILPVGVETIGVGGGSLEIIDTGGGDWLKIPLNKMGRNIQFQITDEDTTGTKSWELNAINVQYIPLSTAFQPGTLA